MEMQQYSKATNNICTSDVLCLVILLDFSFINCFKLSTIQVNLCDYEYHTDASVYL